MTIGALTLTPVFKADVLEYAATTTDATNKITATTDDPSSVILIELDHAGLEEPAVVENGKAATWGSGENTVTITVTDGTSVTEYVVVVTKSE